MATLRLCVFLIVVCVANMVIAQDLPELARRQALQQPGVPLVLPSPPADYVAESAEQLARESTLVVEARLSKLKSYLWQSNDRVLTDYVLVQPSVIAGTPPAQSTTTPGVATPQLTVTVFGGEISLNGAVVRATDINREQIDEQTTYLLFLRNSRAGGAGHYEIYDGAIFEVRGSQIRPLARQGADLFTWALGTSRPDVLLAIRSAVPRF